MEIEDEAIVEDLKVIISVETNMMVDEQLLLGNGKMLADDRQKVNSYGIGNEDMIILSSVRQMQAATGGMR